MSYPNLRRSILALAIAGASLHVHANTTVDISNGPKEYYKQPPLSGPMTVIGTYTGESEVFELEETRLNGNLTLNADITSKAPSSPGVPPSAVVFEEAYIDGNLLNKGSLTAIGEHAETVEMEETTLTGSLVNEGSISVQGTISPLGDSQLAALNIEESIIEGSIQNSGTISGSATGNAEPGAPAIVSGITIAGTTVKKSVVNSGDIEVDGGAGSTVTAGILVEGLRLRDEYTGEILSGIEKTTVIEGQLSNTGAIVVKGNNATGILIGEGATLKGGLHNTGTIHGDTAGIQMEGTDTTLNITQAGGKISGGEYAINQGNNTANLTLTGGELNGNLNVNNIDVTGSAKITANTVDAKQLTVKNGGQLSLAGNTGAIYLDTDISLVDGEIRGDFKTNDIDVTGSSKISANHVQAKYLEIHSGGQLNLGGASGAITLDIKDLEDPSDGFMVKKGGVLGLELSGDYGDAGQPLVTVNGDLTFESGSTVSLSAVKGFTLDGQDYFLIGADSIAGDKEGLVEGSALLKVNSYEIADGKNLFANVSIVSGNDFAEDVAAAGGTGNAQAAAAQIPELLASLSNSTNASFQAFADELAHLDAGEAARVAEQMTPDVDGAAASVASQGLALMSGVTSSRTSGIRGQSSGAALTEAGVWAQGLYSDARQGTRNEVAGYNAYTSGMAIGADAKVTDSLTVGVAYGYMDSTVNSKRGNTTEVDGHSFTVYGGYELGNYFVDSSLTYSKNENKSKRQILDTTAKGTYDSNTLGLSVLGGYDFKLDGMTVSPLVGMNYSNTKLDGFTEKGSAAALRSGSQRYEIAELGAGARLSASYPLGQGRLEPQVQAMVYHDFAADRAKSTSAFVNAVGGNSFIAYGAKPERTSYQADVGVDYKIGAFTVGGSYGYVGKKGFDSDTIAAKIRYDF